MRRAAWFVVTLAWAVLYARLWFRYRRMRAVARYLSAQSDRLYEDVRRPLLP